MRKVRGSPSLGAKICAGLHYICVEGGAGGHECKYRYGRFFCATPADAGLALIGENAFSHLDTEHVSQRIFVALRECDRNIRQSAA